MEDKTKKKLHPLLKYPLNILVSIDQFVNVIFGGSPDETISSRLGRNYPNSLLTKIVNTLFFWTPNHCNNEIESDENNEDAILREKTKNYAR